MNIDAMQHAVHVLEDSTAIHFLYFGLGFCAATILWLTLVIGIVAGRWCRRREVKQ